MIGRLTTDVQGGQDSNLQPAVLETAALPIEPPPYGSKFTLRFSVFKVKFDSEKGAEKHGRIQLPSTSLGHGPATVKLRRATSKNEATAPGQLGTRIAGRVLRRQLGPRHWSHDIRSVRTDFPRVDARASSWDQRPSKRLISVCIAVMAPPSTAGMPPPGCTDAPTRQSHGRDRLV